MQKRACRPFAPSPPSRRACACGTCAQALNSCVCVRHARACAVRAHPPLDARARATRARVACVRVRAVPARVSCTRPPAVSSPLRAPRASACTRARACVRVLRARAAAVPLSPTPVTCVHVQHVCARAPC
eukprot:5809137-Pleurochrysis_carterae.AAC.1